MEGIFETTCYFFLFMTHFLMFFFKLVNLLSVKNMYLNLDSIKLKNEYLFNIRRQLVELFLLPRAAQTTDIPTAPMTEMSIKAIQNPFLITLDHVKSTSKGVILN